MNAGVTADLLPPRYDTAGLATVLPSIAASLGVVSPHAVLPLPDVPRAVLVLIDGLGAELLRRRGGHAPYLRSLVAGGRTLTAPFPATTATSMGTLGTGLPPGAHGLVGTTVVVPGEDRVFSELSWEDGPDPLQWQPEATVFERCANAGVESVMVGPPHFDGSGLTRAGLRGACFVAAGPGERAAAAAAQVRARRRCLVYVYWGELDKTGHVHGCESAEWGACLEDIDREVRELARRLPRDTALYVTADHGMVDVPESRRIDVAGRPELAAGVRHVAGETRCVSLTCLPGAQDSVVQTWRAVLGDQALVLTREEVEDRGWWGPVSPQVRARLGEVHVVVHGSGAVVDSRTMRPEVVRLLGQHGAPTPDEAAVPLLAAPVG